jgi:hypothetical protein
MSMSGDVEVEAKMEEDDDDVFRAAAECENAYDDGCVDDDDDEYDEDIPLKAAVVRRSIKTLRGLTSRCMIPHECR